MTNHSAPTLPNKITHSNAITNTKGHVFHSFLDTPLGEGRALPGDDLDDRRFLFPPLFGKVPFSVSFA